MVFFCYRENQLMRCFVDCIELSFELCQYKWGGIFYFSCSNETDKLALLGFKSQIVDWSKMWSETRKSHPVACLTWIKSQISEDPSRVFASWNDSVCFCQWVGVKCD
uniref:Leucine-rich repeat-containing N-terminal plant-type domain-containing protein n=1 Tax=Solanum lycopersicum TaxID=4081 RepID=K4D1C2_SOLLC